jgi:hypothetical protein
MSDSHYWGQDPTGSARYDSGEEEDVSSQKSCQYYTTEIVSIVSTRSL